ncbi:hypothetical protein VPH35_053130 [Triticum aestivum]|uniref:DUF659 domain-containing protein n=2 Tax=Triticum TaxID=4564 RepID=A0A9R1QLZ2_TRITD|nr:unnamed protein product [Triticum aestivum]VAH79875.1 unnamed protein product [Triticum turgidum subsp. durum]
MTATGQQREPPSCSTQIRNRTVTNDEAVPFLLDAVLLVYSCSAPSGSVRLLCSFLLCPATLLCSDCSALLQSGSSHHGSSLQRFKVRGMYDQGGNEDEDCEIVEFSRAASGSSQLPKKPLIKGPMDSLVMSCISKIGAEKIVQVVTDNASNNIAAATAKLLKQKHPQIFWTSCAAHTINLMLQDIGNIPIVSSTITNGKTITNFFYAHTRLLAILRKYAKGDLVRAGATRFASHYLNLKSLYGKRKQLKLMFASNDWAGSSYAKKPLGKRVYKLVMDNKFWAKINLLVNYFEPLANVLRRVDGDTPAMGFLYGDLLQAKQEIAVRLNHVEKYGPIWEIIDRSYYTAAIDSFGTEMAIRQRKVATITPERWRTVHGTSAKDLKKMAIRILSLTFSSSACERNWSAFERVHSKKRTRLGQKKLNDLVYVMFNKRLDLKYSERERDPLLAKYIEDEPPNEWMLDEELL